MTERGNGDKENQAEKKNIKFHQFANRRLPIQFLSLFVASEGYGEGCNGTVEVCMMQEKKKRARVRIAYFALCVFGVSGLIND